MISEIRAWEAEDGTVHASAFDAAKHTAKKQLMRMDCFNEASVRAVIDRYAEILPVLKLIEEHAPVGKPMVKDNRPETIERTFEEAQPNA